MSLKKGGAPTELPVTLTITGQGVADKMKITYHNRKTSEVNAMIEKDEVSIDGIIPFIVKEWDSDFPLTEEGVSDFEDEYPGIRDVIITGFWKARRKELEKN